MTNDQKPQKSITRFLKAKKTKLVLLGAVVFMVPAVGLAAYNANETNTAIGTHLADGIKTTLLHPIKTVSGGKTTGNVKHDFQAAAWGIGRQTQALHEGAKLESKHPEYYQQTKDTGYDATGMKKRESLNDKNDSSYKKKTQQENSKQESKDVKNFESNSENGNSSFKSKIASALLHVFWSTGLGKWAMQNGAAGTIFTYNPFDAGDYGDKDSLKNAQVAKQLEEKVNNAPSQLMFPAASYSSKFTEVIDAIRPIMYAFSAIMLTVAMIVAGTQLGVGSTFNAARGRLEAYRRITDVIISVGAIACIPMFIRMLLQIDGAFLEAFANYLESVKIGDHSLMTVALQLGMDDASIKALTSGKWLGSGFAAIIFVIIYLCAAIGLAVWIKYYYFARMLAFIILMVLGPIFIAMWPFNVGKARTMNWLRDVIGTIFIQPIQAFVITIMATLMAFNTTTFSGLTNMSKDDKKEVAKKLVDQANQTNSNSQLVAITQKLDSAGGDLTVVGNFEMMVMGFIVLILFQPVSKTIAEMFGIGTNMLDNVRTSTSRTLTTGAAIAGTAAVGLGAGLAANGAGLAHGVSAGVDLARAKKAENDLKKAGGAKAMSRESLKRQAKAAGLRNKADKQLRKAMQDRARAKGLVGPNAGRLMGMGLGAGANNIWAMTALSTAGGEIGKRAARLNQSGMGLIGLGLKRADPWRKQNQAAKALNNATDATMASAAKKRQDNAPGPIGSMTDTVKNNSKLSPGDMQTAVQNAQKFDQAVGDFSPDEDTKNSRVQAELSKDRSGDYVSNNTVQTRFRDIVNSIPDGQAYDKIHGTPKNYQQLSEKAAALGFDLPSWQAAHPELGKGPHTNDEEIQAANKAMNNLPATLKAASQQAAGIAGAATQDIQSPVDADELTQAEIQAKQEYDDQLQDRFDSPDQFKAYQQTPAYQQGLAEAQQRAKQAAYANSNGGVVFHKDMSTNDAFNHSVIDANRYNTDLSNRLGNLHVSDGLRQQLLGVTNGLDGDKMVSNINVGHNQTARVINQSLFDKMNGQRAYTLRSQGITTNGRPITQDDIAHIYSPGLLDTASDEFGTPAQYKQYFNAVGRRNADRYAQAQQDWDNLKNITRQASEGDIGAAFGNGVMNAAGLGRYSGFGQRGASQLRGATDQSASQLATNPFVADANANSMSMDEVRKMVPLVKNDRGETTGVAPGSIRVVYGNNYSMLQARDSNGAYHQVGSLGPGEGSMGPGEVAYQDADLTPAGDLVMRMDSATHRPATPYRIDSSGDRVPYSLPNGPVELGKFFTNSSQGQAPSGNSGPYAYSGYMGIPNAPELQQAEEAGRHVYGDQYPDYYNREIRGTYDGMVMTGVDPRDGQTKVMSRVYDNSIWQNMETGYQFRIPVKKTSGEFQFDSSRPMKVDTATGMVTDPTRLNNLREELQDLCRRDQDRIKDTINETILKPTKPTMRNFIYTNPSQESISGTDTFTKPRQD